MKPFNFHGKTNKTYDHVTIKDLLTKNMKTMKTFIFIGAVALLASCSTTAKFPVSTVTNAAEIKATKKQDRHNNNVIEVTVNNLSAASRLAPPKNNYTVWLISENGSIINVGQLTNRNAKKASLEITTPHNTMAVLITTEDQSNLNYPTGVEISTINFKK